jgi:CRP-like cAMP-binding protein
VVIGFSRLPTFKKLATFIPFSFFAPSLNYLILYQPYRIGLHGQCQFFYLNILECYLYDQLVSLRIKVGRINLNYMDSSLLLTQLREVYHVSDKDCTKLIQLFEPIEVKKNQHLFKSGNIAKYVYFIDKGCLRQYYINNNGGERTIYFKVEGGWCSELVSFLDNTPTELNLQALEDSQLQIINQKNWIYAVTHIHSFTMGFIRAQQDTNYMLKKRLAEATVETPEEKYLRFMNEEASLLQRIPLYHIAAYLAMTPETLSRIRKKIAGQ